MIKNIELLYSTSLLLKDKFNYKISLKQKEEVTSPTFFIQVTPLTTNTYLRYNEKLINIVITFTDEVVTQEKLLEIQNDLDDLFDMYLEIGTRKIVFDKKIFNLTDDFLSLTLTLNYLDDKSNVPDGDKYTALMGELIENKLTYTHFNSYADLEEDTYGQLEAYTYDQLRINKIT